MKAIFSNLAPLLLSFILLVRIAFFFLNPSETRSNLVGDATITGVVISEPRNTSRSQVFTLRGVEIVKARFPEIYYGDRVEIKGKIEVTENKAKVLFPQVKVSENPNGQLPFKSVYDFKRTLLELYQKLLPEPEAGLMTGILLGAKSSLDASLKQDIQNAGLTHVVVASGTNLTFVSGLVFAVALILAGRRWANLWAIPMIWIYGLMSGFEPPVVRAAIMVTFTYIARFLGRPSGTWRGLVIAVYLILLYDPEIMTDLGFQLSVAAMSGIIISGGGNLKQIVFAQVFTLPLIVGAFGRYGLLSLISNLLVLWTIPPIITVGTLAGVVGLVSPGLGRFLIIPAQFLLSYFVEVVTFFGGFSQLVLTLPQLGPTAILGIYFIMIAGYWYLYDKARTNKSLG